jgi:uncharacterized OB-fold protein
VSGAGKLVTADVLQQTPDGPRLVGSRCRECDAVTFPAQRSCPRCASEATDEHLLASTGTLWGFTIQGFAPKSPYLAADAPFTPYGVGYVELAGEVLVEARIVATSPEELHVGMPLRLVVVPFHTSESGEQLLTYAFAAVGREE